MHKRNFHYVAMSVMMSQLLKSADFTKTQKSRYLENKRLFFLQIKKIITSRATLLEKIVLQWIGLHNLQLSVQKTSYM